MSIQSLNNKLVIGQFYLQNELESFTNENTLIEVNKIITQKLSNLEAFTPTFEIKSYSDRVSIGIFKRLGECLGIVHLKINKRGELYIPTRSEPKLGMSLQRFEKVFKPGTFNVSDDCATKVVEYINEWKNLAKVRLKEYKFQPKLVKDTLVIQVYKKNREYEVFECVI